MAKEYYDTDSVKQKINTVCGKNVCDLAYFINSNGRILNMFDIIEDWKKQGEKPMIAKIVDNKSNIIVGFAIMFNEYLYGDLEDVFRESISQRNEEGFDSLISVKKVGEI